MAVRLTIVADRPQVSSFLDQPGWNSSAEHLGVAERARLGDEPESGLDANHAYSVERASGLTPSVSFTILKTNITGLFLTTAYKDTTALLQGSAFYRIGADSTNATVPLLLQAPVIVTASLTLRWNSVTNRTYFVERSTNLAAQPPFMQIATNIIGQAETTTYSDTNAVGNGPFFYRVGVQQ